MSSHADTIRAANAHARAWLNVPAVHTPQDALDAANDLASDVLALLAENQQLREALFEIAGRLAISPESPSVLEALRIAREAVLSHAAVAEE